MKTYLVTGASGFLGSAVLRLLAQQSNVRVIATSRRTPTVQGNFKYMPSDLATDPLDAIVYGVDTIIHTAGLAHQFQATANTTSSFDSINRIATARIAEAAVVAGVQHFVHISSVSIYGGSRPPFDESVVPQPVTAYGISKLAAEREVIRVARASTMHATILRLATLFGAGDPGNVGRLIETIRRGRFVFLGTGMNRKSLIHRDDAARACIAAANRSNKTPIEIYNVSGAARTMREVVETIELAVNKKRMPLHVGDRAARVIEHVARHIKPLNSVATTINKWLADDVYDDLRFRQDTRFICEISLEMGIRNQIQGDFEQLVNRAA